jgi:hypothetical protein
MGVRGELFTTDVQLDNRTYFFNVKENRTGDVFLQVVESKNTEGAGFDRHAIVVFEDDMQKFLQGLENTLKFVEKNRKTRLKEQADRGDAPKRVARRKPGEDSAGTGRAPARAGSAHAASNSDAPARTTPKRVRVIAKKDLKKE